MANKQDSNKTGLRYCTEASLKTLPGSPVWKQFEPNSYGDFGGSTTKTARNPISDTRQRKKGVTIDLDASGSFNQDLTLDNTVDVLQGFMFADARVKPASKPINATADITITNVDGVGNDFEAASGLGSFKVGALILASGFSTVANNGVKRVTAAAAGSVTVAEDLIQETPTSTAKIETIGHRFGEGTMAIAMNGNLCRLTSSVTDLTTFGFVEGEWVYLGADVADNRFVNNTGFARIGKGGITSGYLEFDKTSWEPQAEAAGTFDIELYFGIVIKNESGASIKRRSYQLERTLGEDNDGTMSEYLVGAVPNELTLTVPRAEKITCDLSFVAMDHEPRTGLTGVKSGTRPSLGTSDAYNTSNDVARIKLSLVSTTDSNVTPLFAYAEDLTLTVGNNVTADKAIGVLGGFDLNAGTFEVGGSMTVFFADNVAVTAVRNNSDVTLDVILVDDNKGFLVDVPLIALGDGRLNIEQNQSIKLPLETLAAESVFGHTILFMAFPYLPTLAG